MSRARDVRTSSNPLDVVVGKWRDTLGAIHLVWLDEHGRSCNVLSTAPSGQQHHKLRVAESAGMPYRITLGNFEVNPVNAKELEWLNTRSGEKLTWRRREPEPDWVPWPSWETVEAERQKDTARKEEDPSEEKEENTSNKRVVEFQPGDWGFTANTEGTIISVAQGGQAESKYLEPGDHIIMMNKVPFSLALLQTLQQVSKKFKIVVRLMEPDDSYQPLSNACMDDMWEPPACRQQLAEFSRRGRSPPDLIRDENSNLIWV